MGANSRKQSQSKQQLTVLSTRSVMAFNKALQELIVGDRKKSKNNRRKGLDNNKNNNNNNNNNNTCTNNTNVAQQAQDWLLARIAQQQQQQQHQQANNSSGNSNSSNTTIIQLNKNQFYNTISYNIVLQAWAKQCSWEAATAADALLQKLLADPTCQADSYSYAAVLHAYAKSSSSSYSNDRSSSSNNNNNNNNKQHAVAAALRAQALLEQLVQTNSIQLTTDICHNAVMDAWAASGDIARAGPRAEALLRQLQKQHARRSSCSTTTTTPTLQPTLISYNACIKAYAKTGQPDEAQRLLQELKAHPVLQPDKISYTTCMDAWVKKPSSSKSSLSSLSNRNHTADDGRTIAARRAEQLLKELEQAWIEQQKDKGDDSSSNRNNNKLRPDVFAYTTVMTAYAKTASEDYRHDFSYKAVDLLRRLQKYTAEQRPNAAFLNAWIHLLAKQQQQLLQANNHNHSKRNAAAQTALNILSYMRNEYDKNNSSSNSNRKSSLKPCVVTYTSVISVLAQAGWAEQAESLLKELTDRWRQSGDAAFLPNTKTFVSVLNAWSKSSSGSGGKSNLLSTNNLWARADALIQQMDALYRETQSPDLRPNLIVYSLLFQILAHSKDPAAGLRAKELLYEIHNNSNKNITMLRPDANTYANLINAFTKARVDNAAELATIVLEQVEASYHAGNGQLKPTPLLYSAVLQAYAKSASRQGAELAEKLLQRNNNLYKQHGKLYAKPNTLHYNAVIDALARSQGGRTAALRAEELLDELELKCRAGDASLQVKTRTFNAVILAWKNSQAEDAPDRAEALLKRLNASFRKRLDPECRPCRVTLNSVIGVWAKSTRLGAAERAHSFLDIMVQAVKVGGQNDTHTVHSSNYHTQMDALKPDAFSFNSCIDAYSRSDSPDAAQKAMDLYKQMVHLYKETGNASLKPDAITFTSLRNAWSRHPDKNECHRQLEMINQLIFELHCAVTKRE